ncbi:hypothetical protein [Microcystis phage MJing1]|nr:hypothetical protein [Microcystis phage MJing1]
MRRQDWLRLHISGATPPQRRKGWRRGLRDLRQDAERASLEIAFVVAVVGVLLILLA